MADTQSGVWDIASHWGSCFPRAFSVPALAALAEHKGARRSAGQNLPQADGSQSAGRSEAVQGQLQGQLSVSCRPSLFSVTLPTASSRGASLRCSSLLLPSAPGGTLLTTLHPSAHTHAHENRSLSFPAGRWLLLTP